MIPANLHFFRILEQYQNHMQFPKADKLQILN